MGKQDKFCRVVKTTDRGHVEWAIVVCGDEDFWVTALGTKARAEKHAKEINEYVEAYKRQA